MEHQVSISVSKRPQARTVNLKRVTIRERLLRWLLGAPTHLLVIAPNDSVKRLQIQPLKEENNHESN
ncbi:hypothetical protein [Ligilactobacillus ruminis]|uniref:hypothetical protein n=1 Tax=Ligilactobacillus ruminis TaxID=1623 RepID=UPI0005589ACB|nr:hypothetical protein [Ligilactobacillus ruminis]